MSLESFKSRSPLNVPGNFYVTDECVNCDLCRTLAPEHFARGDEHSSAHVKRQPAVPEELALVQEALSSCCADAVHDDGWRFSWESIPPEPYYLGKS